jgi:ABC-2 type transport system permease protein
MALLCYAWLFGFLHFPLGGGLLPMLVALFLSVLATQAFGIFLFCLFPWMRMAMSAAALWSVVSFSISGFSFPAMAMSPTIQMLNNLFPLRHYFLIYANSALNGYAMGHAATSYVALCLFLLLPLPFLGRFKRVLMTYEYME